MRLRARPGANGPQADWVDNYVDTRPLAVWEGLGFGLETSDLHLLKGYNIDVTPDADGCNDLFLHHEDESRHSRPHRFYQRSQSSNLPLDIDGAESVDPTDATAGMGANVHGAIASPGTHKIAFRLDGYGVNASGVEVSGLALSRRELASTAAGVKGLAPGHLPSHPGTALPQVSDSYWRVVP